MRNLLMATAVIAAAASITQVSAADLLVDEVAIAAAAPTGDWGGAYVGAHLGYAWGDVDYIVIGPDFGDTYDLAGWYLGIQGGYNWQMDGFVLGLEGDVSLGDVLSDEDLSGFIDRQINWTASLRARAGVSFDAFLLYGTAGVAVANSTSELFGFVDDTQTHVGWTAGVGAEVMVAEDVSAKLEYRYTDYGSAEYDYGFLATDSDITTHTVEAGVNFHF